MSGQPLFILLCSGEHEKIQMAGMMASVAAVSERPVQVFVSMDAIYAFLKDSSADERYIGGRASDAMKANKVPDAIELFEQGKMFGEMTIHPCSMALDALVEPDAVFVDDLFDEPLGLTKFLSDAETGQLVVM